MTKYEVLPLPASVRTIHADNETSTGTWGRETTGFDTSTTIIGLDWSRPDDLPWVLVGLDLISLTVQDEFIPTILVLPLVLQDVSLLAIRNYESCPKN